MQFISKKGNKKIKIVVNGAGASAMACANLLKLKVPQKNITMLDRKGVICKERENLESKSSHAMKQSPNIR